MRRRDGLTNVRLGVFLEVATAAGALSGTRIAGRMPVGWLHVVFGAVLLTSVVLSVFRLSEELPVTVAPDRMTAALSRGGAYEDRASGRAARTGRQRRWTCARRRGGKGSGG